METSANTTPAVDTEVLDGIPEVPGTEVATTEQLPTFLGGTEAGIEGDFSTDDLVIPYLNLVGKTGGLSDEFKPGTYVYNRDIEVSDGKDPLLVIPLSLTKEWEEKLDFDAEVMPRRFKKLEEAMAEGYVDISTNREAEKVVNLSPPSCCWSQCRVTMQALKLPFTSTRRLKSKQSVCLTASLSSDTLVPCMSAEATAHTVVLLSR